MTDTIHTRVLDTMHAHARSKCVANRTKGESAPQNGSFPPR